MYAKLFSLGAMVALLSAGLAFTDCQAVAKAKATDGCCACCAAGCFCCATGGCSCGDCHCGCGCCGVDGCCAQAVEAVKQDAPQTKACCAGSACCK